jgi:hypothetical protein
LACFLKPYWSLFTFFRWQLEEIDKRLLSLIPWKERLDNSKITVYPEKKILQAFLFLQKRANEAIFPFAMPMLFAGCQCPGNNRHRYT